MAKILRKRSNFLYQIMVISFSQITLIKGKKMLKKTQPHLKQKPVCDIGEMNFNEQDKIYPIR